MVREASLAVCLAIAAGPAWSGDRPGDEPRLGGATGRLRSYISRSPAEVVEVPDVITLKDGKRLEAYFLNIYGDRFVFYVKETERSWLREEVQRSEIAGIDFEQYLERDPVAVRKVEPAKKQPARKDDVLHGVFVGQVGRSIQWTLTFQSEIDKQLNAPTQDATDYGTVELDSASWVHQAGGLPPAILPRGGVVRRGAPESPSVWARDPVMRSHEVRAKGKYYLYAPESVGNDDWVLLISEVIQGEIDHGRETEITTGLIPDEAFILYFSPGKRSFQLAWSNLGSWSWPSLVGIDFRRLAEDDLAPRSFPGRTPSAPPTRPSDRLRPAETPALVDAGDAARAVEKASEVAPRWGTEGWKRPQSRWARR